MVATNSTLNDLHSSTPSAREDAEQDIPEKSPSNTDSTPPTKPNLLESINSKILPPEIVLEELALLRGIHKQLRSESTKAQFLWNAFLQIMGIVFVIIFGVFSVMAYKIGERANTQASEANQLALLSLCFTSNSNMIEGLCGDVFQGATQTVPSLVTLVMGPTPVLPGNVTGVPTSSSLDIENDIAIGVGIPIALVAMVGFWISYRTMWKERFKDVTPTSEAL